MLLLGFLNFTTASSIKSFLLAVHLMGTTKPSVSSLGLPVKCQVTYPWWSAWLYAKTTHVLLYTALNR